jgi:dTDP-D-glucose 4,6-dehydratase
MPNRKWDTSVWIADIKKISKSLNWQPKHTFEEGFLKTIKWSRENLELPPVTIDQAIQSASLH